MMDYATTQARSLGPLLPPHIQWSIDEVDKLYHELTEIHYICPIELAECAWWRQSKPSSVQDWPTQPRWDDIRYQDGSTTTRRLLPPLSFTATARPA
jgi:hypothetical protein